MTAPDESRFPLGPLSLVVAGASLAAVGLLKRLRARRRAAKLEVGYVSEEWLAEHRASREGFVA